MSLLGKLKNIWLYGGSGEDRKKSKALQLIRRQQDPLEEWEISSHLGDGAFSKVFKVILCIVIDSVAVSFLAFTD